MKHYIDSRPSDNRYSAYCDTYTYIGCKHCTITQPYPLYCPAQQVAGINHQGHATVMSHALYPSMALAGPCACLKVSLF